jgi:hydrogenase/urease accessory protein HupE
MMTIQRYCALRVFATVFATLVISIPTLAHENVPAIIDMTVDEKNIAIRIDVNLESLVSGVANEAFSGEIEEETKEYLRLRNLSAGELTNAYAAFAETYRNGLMLTLDGAAIPLTSNITEIPDTGDVTKARISTLSFNAKLPKTTGELKWFYSSDYGDSVLRLFQPHRTEFPEPTLANFVARGETATVNLSNLQPQSLGEIFLDYVTAGFDHIIPKGLDHILFVIGLFLFSAQLRPLVTQVTMFTLAHTITLVMGALGVVHLPGNIVEPLIAASIVFIAVENIFTAKLTLWRPFVIFAFGLLHGLGFASVLSDFGLPSGLFVPALIAFNIGVEIGQLTVIAICFLTVGIWFRKKDWYHKVIVIPVSVTITLIALFWVLERIGIFS